MAARSHGLLAVKVPESGRGQDQEGLRRSIGALDLTALGIGAIVGTGIFVIIGEAIGKTGPSLVLSFVLAAVTCIFSAVCYAELAAAVPVSGSAYSYSYATLGELVAWIIGWDLIIEYGFAAAVVAVGWGGYVKSLAHSLFGLSIPTSIAEPVGKGGTVNLPAVLLVVGVTAVLLVGVRESARFNSGMVAVKLGVLGLFIVLGATAFHSANLHPFTPKGVGGIADAGALIFFAYIGFDAVSTSSEEARDPGRDLPRAIIGSLLIATVIYIAVALVTTGLLPFAKLNGSESPLADALKQGGGFSWGADVVSFGALVAITSVVLTLLYGQTRIMYSMCRDGLLPGALARLSDRRRVPTRITLLFGTLAAILAALLPIKSLSELVNIGTLFAFLLVNIGVIILRRTRPELERPFRVPLVPVVPIVGALLCIYLMTQLQGVTWLRFGTWMVVGIAIYAVYGYRHSKLRSQLA